jgi:hypothetical protein
MVCVVLDSVHLAGPGKAQELGCREPREVAVGARPDPDLVLGQQRALQQDRVDPRQGKGGHGAWRKPGRGQNLVARRDPGRGRPDRTRDFDRVRATVTRDESDDRAAVADEDEGLDDLARIDPEGLRHVPDGRNLIGELFEPRLGTGRVEEVDHALDRLREHARNRIGSFGVVIPMNANLVRLATTESIFRNVNERIAESAQRFDADEAEFVCECADGSCTHRLETPLDDYERVRSEPTHFLLAPGHENEEIEKVVQRRRRFQVVDKFERTVAATVRRLNPRNPRPTQA